MALPICTLSFCCSSYVRISKPTMYSLASCSCSSYSLSSPIKTLDFSHFSLFSQVGLFQFTPWNGLRHVGISISPKVGNFGRRNKVKGKVIYASLFGVGAPEALVIGVVALLVFGPKGLAEVARNLGKTLRAFQPTIRELQEVSREFKNTLEREISLDDDPYSTSNTSRSNSTNTLNQSVSSTENSQTLSGADPNGTPANNAYSSEEYLKITEEQLKAYSVTQEDATSSPPESQNEIVSQSQDSNPPNGAYSSDEQLKASATTKQDFTSSPSESQTEAESQPQATIQETAMAAPQIETPESET